MSQLSKSFSHFCLSMRQDTLSPYLSVQSTCHSLSESFSQSAFPSVNLSAVFWSITTFISQRANHLVFLSIYETSQSVMLPVCWHAFHSDILPSVQMSVCQLSGHSVSLSVCLSVRSQNPSLSFGKLIFNQSVYFLLLLHLLYVTHPVGRSVSLSACLFIELSIC